MDRIQSLWIGPRLSAMERLCIFSFLRHGHEFHLYTYEDVQNVPDGTMIEDAGSILPRSKVFTYPDYPSIPKQAGSYAGFADFFRHKLLLDKSGWWVDMDLICIRPFDFPSEYVFSSGCMWPNSKKYRPNVGALKAPPGSPAFKFTWGKCQQIDVSMLAWGDVGPHLIEDAVQEFKLQPYVQAPHVFCPVDGNDWKQVLDPAIAWNFPQDTYAIHLWNELWRREGQDKDAVYPPDCLYEQLKRKYL